MLCPGVAGKDKRFIFEKLKKGDGTGPRLSSLKFSQPYGVVTTLTVSEFRPTGSSFRT